MSREWGALVGEYLRSRDSLVGVVMLMDIRHPLTALDETLLDWCQAASLPLLAVLTKADKLARGRRAATLSDVSARLAPHGDRAGAVVFSATQSIGRRELTRCLDGWLGCESGPGPSRREGSAPAAGERGVRRGE